MTLATQRADEEMRTTGITTNKPSASGFTKYITDSELRLLDDWFEDRGDNYQLVYNLMKYCGLRISDAIRINESWLQGENLVFTMYKTKKCLVAYLPKKLREWIYDHYIPTHEDKFKRGFLAYNNGTYSSRGQENDHLQAGTIRATFCRFRQFYDLRDVYHRGRDGRPYHRISPHTLRHVFAEKAYDVTGKDVKVVQDLLGHSKAETTLHFYLRGVKSKAHRAEVGELVADSI